LLRVLVIGKYPPIQGGTSNQTLVTVRSLLQHGHHVDVLTNAAEAEMACRYMMTDGDAEELASFNTFPGGGSLTVHQTSVLDATSYMPWA
jgi:hypothetical protein